VQLQDIARRNNVVPGSRKMKMHEFLVATKAKKKSAQPKPKKPETVARRQADISKWLAARSGKKWRREEIADGIDRSLSPVTRDLIEMREAGLVSYELHRQTNSKGCEPRVLYWWPSS
jgi:hypothetical protein